ncbi:hypothetical protein Tco_1512954 [Tanacetum coccineum]
MNTKVGESKLSDISVVQDFIDVFPEDLSMTTTTTSGVPHRFGSWSDVSCEVSISSSTYGNARIVLTTSRHGVHLKLVLELLRKGKLYAKFTKSEAVKNWEVPKTPSEI